MSIPSPKRVVMQAMLRWAIGFSVVFGIILLHSRHPPLAPVLLVLVGTFIIAILPTTLATWRRTEHHPAPPPNP